MLIQRFREVGCSARGNHNLIGTGTPFEVPDAIPSKPANTFRRLITGHVGVRHDGRTCFLLAHNRMGEIVENLKLRPMHGGE